MADSLEQSLREERAEAIRHLLAEPMLEIAREPDAVRLAIRHADWLVRWFENACGWRLSVDAVAGYARLYKRSAAPDATRPLTRTRGDKRPFDRRRYRLLCLVCAALERHPVTTIGLLADALRSEASLDTVLRRERKALVDVLHALRERGIIAWRGGDVDAWVESEDSNAILQADTHRLHALLSPSVAPGRLDASLDADAVTEALLAEPRYGDAADDPAAALEEQRLRWSRHTAARSVLDDPVVHFDDLPAAVVDYLDNPSGRRWLRERVAEAGFELEERAEGLLAVDVDAVATDQRFPAPAGNAAQLALLLIDRLVVREPTGDGSALDSLSRTELVRRTRALLKEHAGWARAHREGEGPAALADEAVAWLARFGLARVDGDGRVHALPALARYRVGEEVRPAMRPTRGPTRASTKGPASDPAEGPLPDASQMPLL